MKKFIENIKQAVKQASKLQLLILALFGAVALCSVAATNIGVVGAPNVAAYVVNSVSGATNYTTTATNGVYPAAISGNTTVTNLVQVNPGVQPDGDIVIQLTAAATSASTTNVTFQLSDSVLPIYITNNPSVGYNQATLPRSLLTNLVLVLNGTTPVTTNIVLSKFSPTPIANGLSIYLESITMGAAATAQLTNYSVVVVQ